MNSIALKLLGSWRPTVTPTLVLLASLFVAGCASRQVQTSDGTTLPGRVPSLSTSGSLPLAGRLTFYIVPFT